MADLLSTLGISIHAPREGGDFMFLRRGTRHFVISIHAPREGGDVMFLRRGTRRFVISIHAPREGGDIYNLLCRIPSRTFQSTPPARGATKEP